MARDKFKLRVSSWCKTGGTTPTILLTPLAVTVVAYAKCAVRRNALLLFCPEPWVTMAWISHKAVGELKNRLSRTVRKSSGKSLVMEAGWSGRAMVRGCMIPIEKVESY